MSSAHSGNEPRLAPRANEPATLDAPPARVSADAIGNITEQRFERQRPHRDHGNFPCAFVTQAPKPRIFVRGFGARDERRTHSFGDLLVELRAIHDRSVSLAELDALGRAADPAVFQIAAIETARDGRCGSITQLRMTKPPQ